MIIRLEDNPKIVVRRDQYQIVYTGTSIQNAIGSGGTTVTINGSTMTIYTPTGGTATWGAIFGTLSNQTDLQAALDAKLSSTGLTGYWTSAQTSSYVTGLGYLTGVTWTDVTGKPELWTSGQTVAYVATQIPDISGKLDTTVFSTYTGDTSPILSGLRTDIDTVSGDTVTNADAIALKASQADLETHSGNTAIHFEQSAIQIAESQVTDLPTDLGYLQTQIDNLSALQSTSSLFIFEHTDSDISGYEVLSPEAHNYSATTETIALTAGGGETLIDTYATPATGLAVTGITSGSWITHFHAYTSSVVGTRQTYMRFKYYRRDTGGTETLLWTSTDTLIDSTTLKEFQNNETQITFTGFSSTDRLVVKVYGVQTGLDANLSWSYGTSDINSYISVPITNQTAPLWANVASKPQWLDYSTLSDFQTGHTHSYANITGTPDLNAYTLTGTTQSLSDAFDSHSGNTAIHFEMSGITGFTSTNTFDTYTGNTETALAAKADKLVTINSKTSDYTTVDGDSNEIIECASGCTGITLHSGATTGFQVTIVNLGGQTITFSTQSPATLTSKASAVTLVDAYGAVSAYKNGTVWRLIGDLT